MYAANLETVLLLGHIHKTYYYSGIWLHRKCTRALHNDCVLCSYFTKTLPVLFHCLVVRCIHVEIENDDIIIIKFHKEFSRSQYASIYFSIDNSFRLYVTICLQIHINGRNTGVNADFVQIS